MSGTSDRRTAPRSAIDMILVKVKYGYGETATAFNLEPQRRPNIAIDCISP
jgi:hypothetical protein